MLVVGKHISLTNYCGNFKKKRDCFYLEKNSDISSEWFLHA